MLEQYFSQLIKEELRHEPTPSQARAIRLLSRFQLTPCANALVILRGYAGTGKTSLVAALVRVLKKLQRPVVLLAPTGRAAKVFSLYAGHPAYTIHRFIYRQDTFKGEDTRFSLGFNSLKNALFIVDEASMIASGEGSFSESVFGTGQLLDDLLRFVYGGNNGCRLIMVGDTAQLPPVGEADSPALQDDVFTRMGMTVGSVDLTDVVRQDDASQVLAGATHLRQMIAENPDALPCLAGSAKGEVRFLPGDELIEALVSDYDKFGADEVIVVTRSNKRANVYNNGIRSQIFYREEELSRGDLIMAVKNNYHWPEKAAAALPKGESLPFSFIANGDVAEVLAVRNVHEQYGFRFADVTLRFPDYDGQELDCRVLLSTLQSEAPALTADESRRLYEAVLEDYAHISTKKERMKALRSDAYYNALQIKYAYAVTCHKAQGGQWRRVYIDQGYLPPDALGVSYLRWLYTAFTRTSDRLYLVNWPEEQRVTAP